MKKQIEYFEFPNGEIVKRIESNEVYKFNQIDKSWVIDPGLTAEFAWDKPYGEPCENLRSKIDITCDLPPFPEENEFFPGNTVFIGAYPQASKYDFSPIEWIVLETYDSTALCISKKGLITSGYCDGEKVCENKSLIWWESSLARDVCNRLFFNTAFSENEKKRILPKRISHVQFGAECTDSVFLLSEQEVFQYFPTDNSRKAEPTLQALITGALRWINDTKTYTGWWILPEENAFGYQDGSIYPKVVFPTGQIVFHGRNIFHKDFTIRPCIQIRYKNN